MRREVLRGYKYRILHELFSIQQIDYGFMVKKELKGTA